MKKTAKKHKSIHYYDWCYKENFYFLLGWKPESVLDWLKRNGEENPVVDINKYDGCVLVLKVGYAIWVREKKRTPKFYSNLAHECIHAATECLNHRHIEVSYKNDEVLCYLTECLVKKALVG